MKRTRKELVSIFAQMVTSSSMVFASFVVSASCAFELWVTTIALLVAVSSACWFMSIDGKKQAVDELFAEENYRKLND